MCSALSPRSLTAWVLAAVVLWSSPGASQYTYSDDFSTDKAATDSYMHSDFHEELPDPWPIEGLLIYESHNASRCLSFYNGTGNDSYARLYYSFPLEGPTGHVYETAVVTVDLVDTSAGWLQCGCSLQPGPEWAWPVESDLGTWTVEFVASVPPDTVAIMFRGCNVSIDDLHVTLRPWTTVSPSTWGRIRWICRER